MNLYNIEIFTPELQYKSSYQVQDLSYEYDYLSIKKNKIRINRISAARNDYIRITNKKNKICGIVEGVTDTANYFEIQFKPLLSLFDVKVFETSASISSIYYVPFEEWIADVINKTFINNEDKYQNIKGLEVKTTSSTMNAVISIDNIFNLYTDVLCPALIRYRIIIEVDIDFTQKKIIATIGANNNPEKVIESDLPNVIDPEFVINKTNETVNKLQVINQEDETQSLLFYLSVNGDVTMESITDALRVTPVVFDCIDIKPKTNESFQTTALTKAVSVLTPKEYDRCITIPVLIDDTLVEPLSWSIGDRAMIIGKNEVYHTILTGINIDCTKVTLMFGAIRLELTKKLKRRNR